MGCRGQTLGAAEAVNNNPTTLRGFAAVNCGSLLPLSGRRLLRAVRSDGQPNPSHILNFCSQRPHST